MAENFELSSVGKVAWEDRYAKKDEKGNVLEKDVTESFRRVAKAVASKEKEPKKWKMNSTTSWFKVFSVLREVFSHMLEHIILSSSTVLCSLLKMIVLKV